MSEIFLDGTGIVMVTGVEGNTLVVMMPDGTILFPPSEELGVTTLGLELFNPRGYVLRQTLYNDAPAGVALALWQTGTGAMELDVTGATEGEEYLLTLILESPDGLRRFEPFPLKLRCVTFQTGLENFIVEEETYPAFTGSEETAFTVTLPYGITGITLGGGTIHPRATLSIYAGLDDSPSIFLGSGVKTITLTGQNLMPGDNFFYFKVTTPGPGEFSQGWTLNILWGAPVGQPVSSVDDLERIGLDPDLPLDGDYELIADIVLPDDWTPIGRPDSPFTGIFDGNGRTITIPGFDSSTPAGFFGTTNGAEIKDLDIVLSDATTGAKQAGGAAGVARDTTFENVTVSGSMTNNTSNADIGGLVGQFYGGRIYRCAAEVDITANFSGGGSAGGLVGLVPSDSLSIDESYASGDIVFTASATQSWQNYYVGGLVGFVQSSAQAEIKNCYAAEDLIVRGSNSYANSFLIGGLIGHALGSQTIENCYASGAIKDETGGAENRVGGLFGALTGGASAIRSAALSPFLSAAAGTSFRIVDENAGGVLAGNIANSGMTINNATVSGGAANNQNGEDKSPGELQSQAAYAALGWDFASVWKMNSAAPHYPLLQWSN
ncbi:MAG: hypothetical protein LBQ61_04325 [Spirochaetales bacterium]|jgi:hypothetical protein|nr:hypothetical protein [Spirochaetales bacterium]